MSRMMKMVCAVALLLLSAGAPAYAVCDDEPGLYCGRQCTFYGESWYCWDPSNPERLCVSYAEGGCGEDSSYPCCAGGLGAF